MSSIKTIVFGATLLVAACAPKDSADRVPLWNATASATGGESIAPGLTPTAAAALEAGNAAYREKKLDVALAKYQEAAAASPTHAAPWFGIFMAANEMKNSALADSAMRRVKALSADPAALDAHATVTSEAKNGLPAGHPKARP